eukprot:Lankesteria_metandrocarpae@DN5276_c0_g1_i1.p1
MESVFGKQLCLFIVCGVVLSTANKDDPLHIQRRGGLLNSLGQIEEKSYTDNLLPSQDIVEELLNDWLLQRGTNNFPTENNSDLKLSCGGYTTGGQDYVDVAENIFAVADGVGGNVVSPSSFAVGLVQGAVRTFGEARMFPFSPSGVKLSDDDLADTIFRQALLQGDAEHERKIRAEMASMRTKSVKEMHSFVSSSTLLFGFLSENGRDLLASNVGDGGISVLRRTPSSRWKRSPALVTKPINQSWNCPTQLQTFEDTRGNQLEKYRFPLQEGDIIVAGSDGILDHMYLSEMEAILSRAISPYEARYFDSQNRTLNLPEFLVDSGSEISARLATPPGLVAKYITVVSRWLASSPPAWSPFTVGTVGEPYLQGEINDESGKPDDVSVSVCWVEKRA